jgi:hypothetical protein
VCQNVQESLSIAKETWKISPDEWKFEPWQNVVAWILEEHDQLTKIIGDGYAAEFDDKGRHPVSKYLKRYSVYAAMCNSQEDQDKECQRSFRLLQAHLLIAHVAAIKKYKLKITDWESSAAAEDQLKSTANPYLAALAVRYFSHSFNQRLLMDLPVDSPPKYFLEDFSDQQDELSTDSEPIEPTSKNGPTDEERFHKFVVFYQKALGDFEQKTRNVLFPGSGHGGGPRVQGGRSDFRSVIVEDDSDFGDPNIPEGISGRHATVKRIKITHAQAMALLDVDDYPLEDEDEEQLERTTFDKFNDNLDFHRDPGAYQEASSGQTNHVVMANQIFRWSYGTLATAELHHLIVELPRQMMLLTQTGRPLTPKELADLDLLALMQVMFWTSSSRERARSLRICRLSTDDKRVALGFIPSSESEGPRWRILAPLPRYPVKQESVPDGMARSWTELLELPDVVDGSLLVRELIKQRNLLGQDSDYVRADGSRRRRKSGQVFRWSKAWYKKQLKNLLDNFAADLADSSGFNQTSRLTEDRISNFMLQRVIVASRADLAVAAIITGRMLPLARVRLFYAYPSVERLQFLFTRVTTEVDSEFRSVSGNAPIISAPTQPAFGKERTIYVGNRLCPTLKTVQQAIHRLKQEIGRYDYSTRENDEELCRYHNIYTFYTMLMFFYCTGVRGIRTPYLGLSEIDPVLGLAKLSDKDSRFGNKTKLVWVPPVLHKQMQLYNDFIDMSPHLSLAAGKPCFFVNNRIKPRVIRPRELTPYMREFLLPFPVNIHRRFISSGLLERGCPPEIVSAWMGHWHRGEEPWGKFSSFSFGEYRRNLKKYLLPIIEGFDGLGFRQIPCFTRIKEPNE